MPSSYRECPDCGKRALSIATRCPQCGRELLGQPIHVEATRPAMAWARPLLAAATVLAGIGVALAAMRQAPARVGKEDVTGMLVAAPLLASPPPPASGAVPPFVPLPPLPPSDLPPVPQDSMPAPDAVPRVARTWTKVHDRRSVQANLVAVLLPGDTVLVDSLRARWWRVALEGRVIGYVYAGTLLGD
jgi:hypothetical protein